jgi:hypothetical protein
MVFSYVYILQSEADPERFYTGSTFARNVVKSEGCHAGALAEADVMGSRIRACELQLGKPAIRRAERF